MDSSNQMPLNPNQMPMPGQKVALPTDRVTSSIPKGGTQSDTWQYPSEQMFFNALRRKGKGDDVDEEVVGTIVKIHNSMNERTWGQVLAWEALHPECAEPRLSRFMGRPNDLTPRAWLRGKLGYPLPFDRHDWIVDRCGTEVRYVIDYYHHDDLAHKDATPKDKGDWSAVQSIEVYARPAIDGPAALWDRIRVLVAARNADAGPAVVRPPPPPPPAKPKPKPAAAVDLAAMTRSELDGYSRGIQTTCAPIMARLKACGSNEAECQKASVALFHCMASLVCGPAADAFAADPSSEPKLDDMVDCVGRFEARAAELMGRTL